MKPILVLRIAAISGALAVALGALGAHTLKPLIAEHRLVYFEKAVYYQFFHTLAMLVVGILMLKYGASRALNGAAWAFLLGIGFFSGSLYLLAITEIAPTIPGAVLGPITPIGGLCFIAGWVFLFIATFQWLKHA